MFIKLEIGLALHEAGHEFLLVERRRARLVMKEMGKYACADGKHLIIHDVIAGFPRNSGD